MPIALITGGSKGLGKALATALAERDWNLILDARGADNLDKVATNLGKATRVIAVPGDVTDSAHRDRLSEAIEQLGGHLDLLVNNASTLGPTPLPHLAELDPDAFSDVLATNLVAPLRLFQMAAGRMTLGGIVLNISSDAAVEAYPGWGAYGSAKAGLDHLSAVLGAENPDLHVYAFDPGDMRTDMHQAAFPGEDISDRPLPEEVVPAILHLIETQPPSGRLTAASLEVTA